LLCCRIVAQEAVQVRRGERIAQLVVAPVLHAVWKQVSSLPTTDTARGAGGYGSTGMT
jgi:dUTP pyrophosphatase